ncbi:MAG: glutamate racemase [Muribaculaceae bacterium]|nr:glutamate racemase [Muribaculaceae bacterium]
MKIGVFDSGYGGLTILKDIRKRLPQYDYLYLGDNARNPYGSRSFEIVYEFTLQAVKALFQRECHLVILACNTASAKALRSIQQNNLPSLGPTKRVLGVIRPTVEVLPDFTHSKHVGLLATPGTVKSNSYSLELQKLAPEVKITEHACPMWVPIVENNEIESPGADYFVKKEIDNLMNKDPDIDTVVLGCTHYPLLENKIRKYLPETVKILCQGPVVADSLADYLQRHPEIESKLSKGSSIKYLTTEHTEKFDSLASLFLGKAISSHTISIPD